MNVGATQINVQWDEIQRVATERSSQRQQMLAKQYGAGSNAQSMMNSSNHEQDESQRAQRVVFTKNGKLQQNYVPKGTLFDRVG